MSKIKSRTVVVEVPSTLIRNNVSGGASLKVGTVLEVVKSFSRNGEGWLRMVDGSEIPDFFAE